MPRNPRRRPRRLVRFRPALACLESRLVLSAPPVGPGTHVADVLSYHDDNSRTGSDPTETALSPATVDPSSFGKLFSYPVEGQVYAQPLYVQAMKMADGRVHSVIYAATEDDQVYALDATNPTAGPAHDGVLWHDSFIDAARGITPVSSSDVDVEDISPDIGITGTPVIDPATGAIYLVAKTKVTPPSGGSPTFVQTLYELNLASGRVMNSATLGTTTTDAAGQYVDATAITSPGTGTGSIDGVVPFNALREDQRAGLALDANLAAEPDGEVIIAYSSHGDINPYHGWVLGYNPRTLQLETTFNTAPDGEFGAIWQGGGAPTILADGDILASTGNATFDAFTSTATPGAAALGDSGPGLGYEGLNNSVAISFNAVDPTPGTSGTGLYYGGVTPVASPVAPNQHENLSGTGIDFNAAAMDPAGPHTFAATIAYDGSTLSETIEDLATGATYAHSDAGVNIPAAVGGPTAYVGFGGADDGLMSVENIQSWTFGTAAAPGGAIDHAAGFAAGGDLTLNGLNASFTGGSAQLTDGGGEEVGTLFASTPVDVRNFVTTFQFQFAPPPPVSTTSGSPQPNFPIGDGITFILQNADGHPAGPDHGESVLDLRPTGNTLAVVDSFTPSDYLALIEDDRDLGSTATLMLPSFPGTAHPDLALVAGKGGTIYLFDVADLGGYNAGGPDRVVQEISNPSGNGFFASPSYSNGKVYYQAEGDVLRSFSLVLNPATDTMNLVADPTTSPAAAGYPGTSPATSSDGDAGGIVWTIDNSAYRAGGPAILMAYDANNLGDVLFTSAADPANRAGAAVKFVTPTIANGRVYAGLANEVDVYGLLSGRNPGS